jgi:nucleotide-binding universal stress UspA family protein
MPLFRRILVPHDFSDHATRALRVAADLARREGGRIVVLHVVVPYYPGLGFPSPEEVAWTPSAELVNSLKVRLCALVARTVRGAGAPRVDVRVVLGDVLAEIAGAAKRVDSIVMATHGRTGLAHLVIGSVTEKVVRHATVPVLVLRSPRPRTARRAGGEGRRVSGKR